MKVVADERLFNCFKDLGNRISSLGSIVQNDTEITQLQLDEFCDLMYSMEDKIADLRQSVQEHIDDCNDKWKENW